MASGAHSQSAGDILRKSLIVLFLIAGMLLLHQFAVPAADFDPRGLLALGFVVLAAYTVGDLSEVVRIPHITGYLLAGLVFGPSVAHLLTAAVPEVAQFAPLGEGILSQQVIQQLGLIDDLALALIALTAGGELKFSDLRRNFTRSTLSMGGMMAVVLFAVVIYIGVLHAAFPTALPQLASLDRPAVLALALVLGTLATATSPAVVIAIINSTHAKGPVSTTSLIAVVVNQLAVAILFTATLSIALQMLGASGSTTVGEAAANIAASIGIGVVVGLGIALYLRYVGAELLLFLVGLIYATTFVLVEVHGEPAIAFIAAGIVVRNLSNTGETLIREVELLSGPVYVVFFALAGAKLHLDALWEMLLPAIGLFAMRLAAVYAGSRLGSRLARAPIASERYGWTGFVSQAGLAIVLAGQMRSVLPDGSGEALYSLALSVVALSEMVGPIIFQAGLGAAGEIGGGEAAEEGPEADPDGGSKDGDALSAWPIARIPDPWGRYAPAGSEELDQAIVALEHELRALIHQHVGEAIAEQQRAREGWLRHLRREWLRVVRRAITNAEGGSDLVAESLRSDAADIGARWRKLARDLQKQPILARSSDPMALIEAVDHAAVGLRRRLTAGVVDAVLAPREEGYLSKTRRAIARTRNRWLPIQRTVYLRDIGRYHLSGVLPGRLEALVAVMIQGDQHLCRATAEVFDQIAADFEEAARLADADATPGEICAHLAASRSRMDPLFQRVLSDLAAVTRSVNDRAASAIAERLAEIRSDAARVSTLDLAAYRRRYNRVFAERNRGLKALTDALRHATPLVASARSAMALQLELAGFEARARSIVRNRGNELERHLRGRGPRHMVLVNEQLTAWLEAAGALLADPPAADELSKRLRKEAEPLTHRLRESRATTAQLVGEVSDEAWVADLVQALLKATADLSESYTLGTTPHAVTGETVPPPPATTTFAFRELVSAFLESTVARELLDVMDDLTAKVREMMAALDDVDRVASFNIELSHTELDLVDAGAPTPPETAQIIDAMVIGAIGRSQHRLARLTEVAELTADHTEQRVHDCVIGQIATLRARVASGEIGDLRSVWLREVRIGQLARSAETWSGWLPTLWGRSVDVARRALGEERLEAARATLGLPPPAERRDQRTAFAPPEPAVAVPVVYRRLFSDLPLEAGDLLAGRSAELDKLRAALVREGPLRVAAVVGTDHQSASALATAAARGEFAGVIRLDARAPADLSTVADWLEQAARVRRHVVIVEGLYWLFERRPGGMVPLERLIDGMIADAGRNAWLLVSDSDVWDFLGRATALHDATSTVVSLSSLTEEELERAVLARHAMSGYEVRFDADEDLGWQLQHVLLRGEDRERRRRHAWFRTLHNASAGMLQDALRLWMAAIVEVDDRRELVRIGTVPRPPVTRLHALPEDIQLTLLETSRQGWTSAEAHARLFQIPPQGARAHLANLHHLGLLVADGEIHRIAPHLRGAVHRVLRWRGWT